MSWVLRIVLWLVKIFAFICSILLLPIPPATTPRSEMVLFTVYILAEGPCQQHGGETWDWGVVVSGFHSER